MLLLTRHTVYSANFPHPTAIFGTHSWAVLLKPKAMKNSPGRGLKTKETISFSVASASGGELPNHVLL